MPNHALKRGNSLHEEALSRDFGSNADLRSDFGAKRFDRVSFDF